VTAPTARLINADELAAWFAVPRTAMLGPPVTPEQVETVRPYMHPERCVAAYDGSSDGRPVGSAGSFPTEVTVPGGKVAAGAVTAVGVLPTHRRQGHLTRLMQTQLADIAERDEPLAILVAAEYPIYGRFGYGPSSEACAIRIDTSRPGMWRDPPTGSTELVDNDVFTKTLVELYERVRHDVVGHMSYEDSRWKVHTGELEWPDGQAEDRRKATKVVWRDAAGEIGGVVSYTVKDRWVDNRPQGELHEQLLVTASPEAEREVLRYLSAVDWIHSVHIGTRAVDDPAPLWLHDGRAAVMFDRSDHVWTRLLDVPRALSARNYAADGRLVLEVDDPMGFANGRFALEGGPDGSLCAPSSDDPDLVLSASALGAAYVGGVSWARLAAAHWVAEARPGALERASTMFTTPRAPWCAMTF
jgi:predicted acetyltransferase